MSDSKFFVSHAAIRHPKSLTEHRIRHVSSARLSEAIAAALGFKTRSLRSAFAQYKTVEVSKPNNALLKEWLKRFGYTELFRTIFCPNWIVPIHPSGNIHYIAARAFAGLVGANLMVAAINAGLMARHMLDTNMCLPDEKSAGRGRSALRAALCRRRGDVGL